MLFYRANAGEVGNLQQCPVTYVGWSRQVINLNKSFFHFSCNKGQEQKDLILSILRLQAVLAGKYLGLTLCIPRPKSQACKEIQGKGDQLIGGLESSVFITGREDSSDTISSDCYSLL